MAKPDFQALVNCPFRRMSEKRCRLDPLSLLCVFKKSIF